MVSLGHMKSVDLAIRNYAQISSPLSVAADAARNPRNFGEEIEPAPISPQDV